MIPTTDLSDVPVDILGEMDNEMYYCGECDGEIRAAKFAETRKHIQRVIGERDRLSSIAGVQEHRGRSLHGSNDCDRAFLPSSSDNECMNTKRKYLAFDIETARTPEDETDWRSCRPLGISCAATLLADSNELRLWHGGKDRNVRQTE